MPKDTIPAAARSARRHNPLEADITAAGPLKNKSSKRKSRSEDDEEKFVDSKSSRRILQIGQELAEEDKEENRVNEPVVSSAFDFGSRFDFEDGTDGDELVEEEVWGGDGDVEEEEVAPGDREMFDRFNPTDDDPLLRTGWTDDADIPDDDAPVNLADLILQKIEAFEAQEGGSGGRQAPGPVDDYEIPGKVVEVYTKYENAGV